MRGSAEVRVKNEPLVEKTRVLTRRKWATAKPSHAHKKDTNGPRVCGLG